MQYIIELGANGMEATSYTLPQVDLLQKLRDRLKAWEQLDRKFFKVIPGGLRDFGECRAYELVAGTFSTSNGSNLFVNWLPSATHDGRVLRHETIGLSVRDFAIDPTEDIIVFLEDDSKYVVFTLLVVNPHLFHTRPSSTLVWTVRLYLRTISSNRPHPLAREEILSFDIPVDAGRVGNLNLNPVVKATLQLAYDMLSLSITTGLKFHGLRVLVWNWKTSRLLFVCLIFCSFASCLKFCLGFAE